MIGFTIAAILYGLGIVAFQPYADAIEDEAVNEGHTLSNSTKYAILALWPALVLWDLIDTHLLGNTEA